MKRFAELNYYELLDISLDATPFEVRQAYKKFTDIYDKKSLATYSFFAESERDQILKRLKKAFLTLADDEKRAAYDYSLIEKGEMSKNSLEKKERRNVISIAHVPRPNDSANHLVRVRQRSPHKCVNELIVSMESAAMITGNKLRNLREALGIEVEEIYQTTKISPSIVDAIEKDDFTNLPPPFYLKSFLRSYAEVLEIDPQKIVAGYFQNMQTGQQ